MILDYPNFARKRRGFTLIEVMVVVAIIGLVLTMGAPSVVRSMQKEGMRKAVSDLVDACKEARAQAILQGKEAQLVMNPLEGSFEVPGAFRRTSFPPDVHIEILGVNWIQYEKSDNATVRFFPNGTSEEFTIVLNSDRHEVRKISLDIVTALPDVEEVR